MDKPQLEVGELAYYDDFLSRVSQEGSTPTEVLKNQAKELLQQKFTESVSYYSVMLNGSTIDAQIVDDSQTRDEKLLTTYYETPILSGSVIEWKSATDKWIVIHYDEMSEIYKRCRIRKCLGVLKWLDENGIVRQVDFTLSSPTASNFGVEDGRIITIGNERRQLLIPKNEFTVKFKKDKRFLFDDNGWRVTSIDRLMDGLITLTVDEDQFNPATDYLELGIADYYGNEANYTVEITNGDSISINVDSTVQINTVVRNNSEIVADPLSYSSSDPSIATIDNNGVVTGITEGAATVTASLTDNASVIDSIVVTVAAIVEDNYTVEITGVTEIKNNQSKSYTASIWNNGVQVTGDVTWSLFSDDMTSSTTLASITSQSGTMCTVKNNATNNGYVRLKATYGDVEQWLRIQMKPLF